MSFNAYFWTFFINYLRQIIQNVHFATFSRYFIHCKIYKYTYIFRIKITFSLIWGEIPKHGFITQHRCFFSPFLIGQFINPSNSQSMLRERFIEKPGFLMKTLVFGLKCPFSVTWQRNIFHLTCDTSYSHLLWLNLWIIIFIYPDVTNDQERSNIIQ